MPIGDLVVLFEVGKPAHREWYHSLAGNLDHVGWARHQSGSDIHSLLCFLILMGEATWPAASSFTCLDLPTYVGLTPCSVDKIRLSLLNYFCQDVCFSQQQEKKWRWKLVLRRVAIAVVNVTIESKDLWDCLEEGCGSMEVWVRKVIECCKHRLTGHSHRIKECKNSKRNAYSKAWHIRFQWGMKNLLGAEVLLWWWGHRSSFILLVCWTLERGSILFWDWNLAALSSGNWFERWEWCISKRIVGSVLSFCACICISALMLWTKYGDQKTSCRSWFFPSTV